MASSQQQQTVVLILGPTGVGKSALAISLALQICSRGSCQAEILNTDAMQMYKALPVLTAKVSREEMSGVRHRMMDFLDPGMSKQYTVLDFKRDAEDELLDMQRNDIIPILVGGTAYYAQHLLFPSTSHDQQQDSIPSISVAMQERIDALDPESKELIQLMSSLPAVNSPSAFPPSFPVDSLPEHCRDPETFASKLWQAFNALSPSEAAKWHWRDVRKVRRHLERYLVSDQAFNGANGEEEEGSKYRVLAFWLHAEKAQLDARLDARVDRMIEAGLLDEVTTLRSALLEQSSSIDYTSGVAQSIGFKPFAQYLALTSPTTPDLELATEQMKIQTRQYAKKQISWFKGKFVPAAKTEGVELFVLDATDLDSWHAEVEQKAKMLLDAFMERSALPDPLTLNNAAVELRNSPSLPTEKIKFICDICTEDPARPHMIDESLRLAHERSKAHQGRKRARQRAASANGSVQVDTG